MRDRLTSLGTAPALLVSSGPEREAAERGTILLLHGFTASKEVQYKEAHSLAEHGYLVAVTDAVGHGARRLPDFKAHFSVSGDELERRFFAVVKQTADELPGVVAALRAEGLVREGRLGACGISMGGAVLFGAMSGLCAFDAVVTMVATPIWQLRPDSPHQRLEKFFPAPLLMHTCSEDRTVSPADARALFEALTPRYASAPDRLRYVEHPGEGHMFSPAGWERAWGETVAWFDRFLGSA
ncbi:MAG TPA: alpha/beta hydrolase [Myxococcaceae bacterium]|nr:alpha/beta hydrolase [Myxococcaceae bacterium]